MVEFLKAAYTLTANDSNKIFMLDLATGFTVTLPQIAIVPLGFEIEFIVKTAPASGTYVVTENTRYDTNIIVTNGINELEVDTGNDGPSNTGHTTITFADGVAIKGDRIKIMSDLTNWYCTGQTKAVSGITLA